jgi:hypothetical protein
MLMKRTLVRYKAKPEMAHENERLITDVFRELQAKAPDGVRYATLRPDDRCAELPDAHAATIVGNYRMLAESRKDE